MKRVLALVVVALAACSAPAHTDHEADYLDDLHTYVPELTEMYDDNELLEIGWSVCDAFAAGATQDQVLDSFAEYPHDVELASLAGAAVGSLCPTAA